MLLHQSFTSTQLNFKDWKERKTSILTSQRQIGDHPLETEVFVNKICDYDSSDHTRSIERGFDPEDEEKLFG
jgi:hypothetical protein